MQENKNNALIQVAEKDGKQVVSARELYEFFSIAERFSKWIERMFEYGFEENKDYTPYQKVHPQNKQQIQDYALTLDTAKEISMIQRTDKGKQARQYFIECEKQLKYLIENKLNSTENELNFLQERRKFLAKLSDSKRVFGLPDIFILKIVKDIEATIYLSYLVSHTLPSEEDSMRETGLTFVNNTKSIEQDAMKKTGLSFAKLVNCRQVLYEMGILTYDIEKNLISVNYKRLNELTDVKKPISSKKKNINSATNKIDEDFESLMNEFLEKTTKNNPNE